MIRMQPYVIAALARHYGLRRSALSSALFDEVEDAAYAAQVGAWYESLAANNRLGQQHLAALLAWTDLEARATFVSLIAHQPRPEVFQAQDIADYCSRESNVPDPRWLLPFLAPLLDPAAITAAAQQTATVLQGLARRGLVEPRGAGWVWTLPGQFLSESFQRRTVTVAVDTAAAGPDGTLGRHACCLLRSDQPLWFMDIPPDGEVTLAGVSILDARKVLDTVLTPAEKAPAWPPPRPQPVQYPAVSPPVYAPAPEHAAPSPSAYAQTPQYATPPVQPVAAPAPRVGAQPMKYCPNCGQALPANAVFCGYCGARQM